ncbi:MAG: sugar kinase [Ignavibacteria bacterium]|nr:sugar kinase [Ignavibacteria bacterium]
MSILVVGSVALDYLETPHGIMKNALGGSATFVSISASYLSQPVRFVGIVGGDFPEEHIGYFQSRGIDLEGLVRVPEGKTFSWGGRYHEDMNNRDTLYTELGVFETFSPEIPDIWKASEFIVLGNIHPILQLHVLDQISSPRYIICDTMNLWIDISREDLLRTIARVDALILNDQEAKMLTGLSNVIAAGKHILTLGPEHVVIKKGEHGALLMSRDRIFSAPAFPLDAIKDPTGAGDSFAGGFAGWLSRTNDTSFENLKRAVICGSTMASFCVEQFSIEGLRDLSAEAIAERYLAFHDLAAFELPEKL